MKPKRKTGLRWNWAGNPALHGGNIMIYYKGYKIKKSKVLRNGYVVFLKNMNVMFRYFHSKSYNEIKSQIRIDIERGKI